MSENGVVSVQDAFKSVVLEDMPAFLRWGQEDDIYIPKKMYGLCQSGDGTKWAAEWKRFSRGAFQLAVTATSVTLPKKTSIGLLTAGLGETGSTGLPYPATDSETDLTEAGAPVDQDQKYVIFALAFSIQKPYVFVPPAPPGPTADGVKTYQFWLRGMEKSLKELFNEELTVMFDWKDNACKAVGGPLTSWPQGGGPRGEGIVTNGPGNGISSLIPLKKPMLAGAATTLSKLTLTVSSGTALEIEFDPMDAPPAEVEEINLPVNVDVYGAAFDTCSVACVPNPERMSDEDKKAWGAFTRWAGTQ